MFPTEESIVAGRTLMLESRVFGFAMFLMSWIFIFHGVVLLFAPNRYLPIGTMSKSTIILLGKPPFHFWRRLAGLCFSVAVFRIFTSAGFT